MNRTFAYCRVSTTEQTTDNQVAEIRAAGFEVQPSRVVVETISGSTAADTRKGFVKLVDRLEAGDVLIVTKLDRLGRNAMDVRQTIEKLESMQVRVHCLALGGTDLTSSTGRLTMQIIGAVAEFERDLLIERTQSGLARAKAQGKRVGRPASLSEVAQADVLARLAKGEAVAQVARLHNTSRTTIQRIQAQAAAAAAT
jgi:putative DNA-invertase from lambdoid prophage Rac